MIIIIMTDAGASELPKGYADFDSMEKGEPPRLREPSKEEKNKTAMKYYFLIKPILEE